jgi:pilus assembly protein CpaB
MSVRNIILIVAAVLITVGTGLVARSWINSRPQVVAGPAPAPAPAIAAKYVLVAATNVPTGTFIKENHLRWQAWPDDPLPESYIVKPKAGSGAPDPIENLGLLGAVVRKGIAAGEPITKGRIIRPGDRGFLAAVLRPGYRAMAIRVTATSGIAGLVFPGDRVDLILTHSVNRDGRKRRASETVLTNVRVLAIDQVLSDNKSGPRVGKNATLELTPKQAEMITVLSELGRVALSLRSLAKDDKELERLARGEEPLEEPDPARGTTHTWDTEVSRLLYTPRRNARQTVVQVLRGGRTTELRFDKTGNLTGSSAFGTDDGKTQKEQKEVTQAKGEVQDNQESTDSQAEDGDTTK